MSSRSPIPNFKTMFTGKRQSVTPERPSARGPLERLPSHVIAEIGKRLPLREVLQLSLCSRRLRKALAHVLYASVELVTNRQCKTTLIALSKQPENAGYVRRLVVRPNCIEWTLPGEEVSEDLFAGLICSIAPTLRYLEAFVWDGLEMPRDDLWLALRTSCKYLRRISTTIGEEPFLPNSHLFDFDDLRQLSLTASCSSLDWLVEGAPQPEKLPKKFWAMLIERCPKLEELTLGRPSPSPRLFDVRHITAGRWSRLHTLTLGDTLMISSNGGEEQARKDWSSFMTFFAWHQSLVNVHLKHAPGSVHFPSGFALPSVALPRLQSFSGPLKFIRTLPNPRNIRHLALTCLHHTSSSFQPTFATLRDFYSLSSLSVWIDMSMGLGARLGSVSGSVHTQQPRPVDEAHIFRALLSACGQSLRHLDLKCFTQPTFPIKEFSSALSAAPYLESFCLTKLAKSSDEDMPRLASRIVVDNPNLRSFIIQHANESWYSCWSGRLKHRAKFEVLGRHATTGQEEVRNEDRSFSPSPVLFGHEMRRGGLMGREQTRCYLHRVETPKEKTANEEATGSGVSFIKRVGSSSRRARRQSVHSSTSSSGHSSITSSVWSGGWSWGSAGEQVQGAVGSPRTSLSSDRMGLHDSHSLGRASISLTSDYVLV